MKAYGIFQGAPVTDKPESIGGESVKFLLGDLTSLEEVYNWRSRELTGVIGIIKAELENGFVENLLISSKMREENLVSVFRYNDHQGEYGRYITKIKVM